MKRSTVKLIVLMLIGIGAGKMADAQKWVELMLKEDANFLEVQTAFDAETEGKSYIKGHGWKQYKRWEAFWETRVNADGSFPSYKQQWDSYQKFMKKHEGSKSNSRAGSWTPLGPFTHVNTDSWSSGQGRINVVLEDPNNANTIYVGAPAGGIWKSLDAGATWVALGDNLPVIGISGIAVDYNNSNIIYISTGDEDGGDTYSIGVWKSLDGGSTWAQTGSIASNSTGKILVDPTNSNVLYVATGNGIFKTTDAATTWAVTRTGGFDDISFKPGDPQTVYGATSNSFYVTTNGGTNWSQTTNGMPTGSSRIKIGTSAANSSYVYLLSADTQRDFNGLFRSTDSGQSFSLRNGTTDIFDGSTQAWYDMALGVSQTNAEVITTGVLNVWRSSNGGSSFTQLNIWNNPSGNAYTHADIHFLAWYGNNLYCGSDGGVYRSTNNGSNFTSITDGLQIGQFYTIAGTEQDPSVLCGGLQDNGGYAWDGSTWKNYYGADGMGSAVDPNNSSRIYGMTQYGNLYVSTNGGNSNNGEGSPEQGAWITPMVADPNNARLLCGYTDLWEFTFGGNWNQISTASFSGILRHIAIHDANSDIIYVGTTSTVYRSNDGGTSWANLSNTLPSNVTSIDVHPTDPDRAWVSIGGTGSSHVYRTLNGGVTWQNISNGLPSVNTNIVKHEIGSANGVYIGTDIGVYYYDEVLLSWIPFMDNLPNVIVNDLEINYAASIIRAGTYGRGVWESGTYNQPIVDEDAGISDIVRPNGVQCGVVFNPIVTLTNSGNNDLTTVNIIYEFDGSTPDTFAWTGSLAQGMSEDVTLSTQIFISGSHSFDAWTADPNGLIDGYIFNDDQNSQFTINPGGSSVHMTLMTDCFGSETTWELRDASSTLLYAGGPYQDGTGDTIIESFCLPDGCYDFEVFDSGGDGMFGSQQGSCTIDGDLLIEDDVANILGGLTTPNFGSDTSMNFCVATPLTAAFTSNKQVICAGLPINFTDQSIGSPTTWDWTFQGGTPATSTNQNTSSLYSVVGVYDVTLIVGNGVDVDTLYLPDYISVIAPPSATASASDETCDGACNGIVMGTVTGGTAPYSFTWSNGLGNGVTIINVCPGTYNLVLTDAAGCTVAGISATVGVGGALAIADFTASDTIVFLNQNATVNFTNTSSGGVAYEWDFDDGNASSATDPSHMFTVAGIHEVELTAKSADSCGTSFTQDVHVYLTDGIAQESLEAAVSLYPNPTNGVLSVQIGIDADATIEVHNAVGKLIRVEQLSSRANRVDMDLSAQAKGLYYVTVWVDGQSVTRKVSLVD
jgi:PKD repeat protein